MLKDRLLIAMLFVTASCGGAEGPGLGEGKSTEGVSGAATPFTTTLDEANFLTCRAADEATYYEWTLDNGRKLTGRTVTFYLEKKGTYEVKLVETKGKKRLSNAQKITTPKDSYYHVKGERLLWNDEFNGQVIDAMLWNYDKGTGQWGNHELQDYTDKPENAYLKDGYLHIAALRRGNSQQVGDYTSARLTTRNKKEINHGRVEVKAKLPGGRGIWPAIWMFGRNADPFYSELDIMEYVGMDKNIIYTTVHTTHSLNSEDKTSASVTLSDVETAYHVYGMRWYEDHIDFYIDNPDKVYLSYRPKDFSDKSHWPFASPLCLILNVAVGGDWAGMKGIDDSIFPCEMVVDWVRVFQ